MSHIHMYTCLPQKNERVGVVLSSYHFGVLLSSVAFCSLLFSSTHDGDRPVFFSAKQAVVPLLYITTACVFGEEDYLIDDCAAAVDDG